MAEKRFTYVGGIFGEDTRCILKESEDSELDEWYKKWRQVMIEEQQHYNETHFPDNE